MPLFFYLRTRTYDEHTDCAKKQIKNYSDFWRNREKSSGGAFRCASRKFLKSYSRNHKNNDTLAVPLFFYLRTRPYDEHTDCAKKQIKNNSDFWRNREKSPGGAFRCASRKFLKSYSRNHKNNDTLAVSLFFYLRTRTYDEHTDAPNYIYEKHIYTIACILCKRGNENFFFLKKVLAYSAITATNR